MALLPHPCLPFFSFAGHEKPPHVTPRPSNFHLSPLPINPPAVRRFGKHHRLVVSQHSSPTAFTDSSSEKPIVVRRQSSYRPPMWDSRFMESLNEGHLNFTKALLYPGGDLSENPLANSVKSGDKLHLKENVFTICLEANPEHEAFTKMRIEELKEKVKNMFIYANNPSQKINLVDTIERLGLAHHFNKEIQSTLQQVYEDNTDFGENLHVVALRFLLLRQHGYHVSCDVFMKFKDKEGSFKQSLRNDVRGLLSLYEASHCSIHGEDIMDSSLGFTRQLLKSMVSRVEPTFARRVHRSLELPPQRSLPRLEAKHFISFYEDDASRNDVLLELSKVDFNLIQSLKKSEIKEVYRWWKELDLGEKLPYARDRVVENYLWGMELNFLPEFSNGRIMLGKLANLMGVMDDTYDTYGTLEEMELFTDAINRWDIEAMDQLPEYLRLLYHALYKLVNESNYMSMKHRENNGIYYIKKMLQDLCKAYMQEARWFNDGHTPSMEENLSISLTTAGGFLLSIVAALVMGDMVDKEGLDYIVEDSMLPKLVTTITRLLDDIGTFKFEENGGDVTKSIECYMIEHGVSQEVAYTHIKNLIAKAWKDINQELLNPIPLPKPIVDGIINYAKGSEVFLLNGNDGFGNSQSWFKDTVDFILFEPIPL